MNYKTFNYRVILDYIQPCNILHRFVFLVSNFTGIRKILKILFLWNIFAAVLTDPQNTESFINVHSSKLIIRSVYLERQLSRIQGHSCSSANWPLFRDSFHTAICNLFSLLNFCILETIFLVSFSGFTRTLVWYKMVFWYGNYQNQRSLFCV